MKCCVPLCELSSDYLLLDTEKVTFYQFPSKQFLRQSWLTSLGMNESHLSENAAVCSQHFQRDDFYVTDCGSIELKTNSVPSVFKHKSNSSLQVCMICLDTASKVSPFTEYLTEAYTNIMGLSNSLSGMNCDPKLCTECAHRLTNCCKFRDKSLSAHRLLLQLYKTHGMLTLENIKAINRVEYKLASNIAEHIIKPDHCDLYFKDALLEETKNIHVENTRNSEQCTEVKIEMSKDTPLNSQVKDETFDFDIDYEPGCDSVDNYNVRDENNDVTHADVKILDVDIDMESQNDSCVEISYASSKIEGTRNRIGNVNSVTKTSDDFDNKGNLRMTNKRIKDSNPKQNNRKNMPPVKDRTKITKTNKKLFSKTDKVTSNIQRLRSKPAKSNKKIASDGVKKVKRRKTNMDKSDKLGIADDVKYKENVAKPKTQDCSDLKLFTVTVLSYEEQLAEIQKRKETDGFIRSPYKCTICYKGYWYTVPYSRHMEKHTNKYGQLVCDICGFHMKSRTHLRKHIKSYHDVRFSCKSCPFVSNDRSQALAHEQWHNGKKYRCPHCDLEFAKRSSYLSHVRIKHPSDCVCALCGFSFVSEKGLKCHMNVTHRFEDTQNPSGPACEECNVRFASDAAYQQHMKVSPKHAAEDALKRNEPQHRLSAPNRSARKDGDAEGGGAILCELCGKSFRWPAQLLQHSQVHTGEKLFACALCDKRFMHKLTLTLHARSHGDRPARYDCAVCGRSFTHYSNRHRHMLSHREARPYYKCDICDKNFTTAQGRNAHLSHVHSNVPRPKRVRSARPRAPGPRRSHAAVTSDSQDS